MYNPRENVKLMDALNMYLNLHSLSLPNNVDFEYVIDGVDILVDGNVVIMIGLPPVSDHIIETTEYTNQY